MTAKISNIYFHNYGSPSMSVTITTAEGNSTFTLKDDDLLQVQVAMWTIIERQKQKMAAAIMNIETPLLITAGSNIVEGTASDVDDIPF
jgi:hypothetical protein